jgi:hypothetical protein
VSAASGSQATSAGGTKRKHGAKVGCLCTGCNGRQKQLQLLRHVHGPVTVFNSAPARFMTGSRLSGHSTNVCIFLLVWLCPPGDLAWCTACIHPLGLPLLACLLPSLYLVHRVLLQQVAWSLSARLPRRVRRMGRMRSQWSRAGTGARSQQQQPSSQPSAAGLLPVGQLSLAVLQLAAASPQLQKVQGFHHAGSSLVRRCETA